MDGPRYAFRDTDLARRRLELVADVFAAPSTAFLQEAFGFQPTFALDLGCGPGRTTRLVAEVTGAALVVGLDMSEDFLLAAPRSAGIAFVRADTTLPFPTRAPDLVYARLLLAHLPDPASVAASWADQLAPGGRLLLDEVEYIRTEHRVLAFYEEIVVGLVGARGAPMYAGPLIAELAGATKVSDTVVEHEVTTADAARMYSMNLRNWRNDPFVENAYSTEAIDDLAAGLDELTRSSATHEIEWGLRQVAYERVS
jgi:SAM-dependent methyltransferase